jgi:hypothetical protein
MPVPPRKRRSFPVHIDLARVAQSAKRTDQRVIIEAQSLFWRGYERFGRFLFPAARVASCDQWLAILRVWPGIYKTSGVLSTSIALIKSTTPGRGRH